MKGQVKKELAEIIKYARANARYEVETDLPSALVRELAACFSKETINAFPIGAMGLEDTKLVPIFRKEYESAYYMEQIFSNCIPFYRVQRELAACFSRYKQYNKIMTLSLDVYMATYTYWYKIGNITKERICEYNEQPRNGLESAILKIHKEALWTYRNEFLRRRDPVNELELYVYQGIVAAGMKQQLDLKRVIAKISLSKGKVFDVPRLPPDLQQRFLLYGGELMACIMEQK